MLAKCVHGLSSDLTANRSPLNPFQLADHVCSRICAVKRVFSGCFLFAEGNGVRLSGLPCERGEMVAFIPGLWMRHAPITATYCWS